VSTSDTDKTTGELDAVELRYLLQRDIEETLGGGDPPTVTLERERLQALIQDSTVPPPIPLAHTVKRERLKDTARVPIPMPACDDMLVDTDLSPTISPLVVLGVIAMLLALFFAATQAT
jgi:hypothetical protein